MRHTRIVIRIFKLREIVLNVRGFVPRFVLTKKRPWPAKEFSVTKTTWRGNRRKVALSRKVAVGFHSFYICKNKQFLKKPMKLTETSALALLILTSVLLLLLLF